MNSNLTTTDLGSVRSNPPMNLTVAEAAEYIGISDRNLRGLISNRKIKFVRIGRRIMLRLKDLDLWIDGHVTKIGGGKTNERTQYWKNCV